MKLWRYVNSPGKAQIYTPGQNKWPNPVILLITGNQRGLVAGVGLAGWMASSQNGPKEKCPVSSLKYSLPTSNLKHFNPLLYTSCIVYIFILLHLCSPVLLKIK